ncbi:MAG: creatininase family protein [Solirubrobacteraceae bacterium]
MTLLEELSWPGVAELVAGGETLCLLPVGATEQHGRHLPLSTDSEIATAICRAASERTGVPVLPTLTIASSHAHTTKWPGTLSYPPRMVIEMIVELSRWIVAAGFRKLLIVNAHGGNIGPLRVAVDEIRMSGELQVGAISWFELSPAIAELTFIDGEDIHASAAETSLMLHLRPNLVDLDAVRDDPDRTPGRVFSYTVAQASVDGLTGSPSLSTPEDGERLFGLIVAALAVRVERARGERPPELGRF